MSIVVEEIERDVERDADLCMVQRHGYNSYDQRNKPNTERENVKTKKDNEMQNDEMQNNKIITLTRKKDDMRAYQACCTCGTWYPYGEYRPVSGGGGDMKGG
ncbi:hypothetical protein SERLADRAFT_399866 [Serpula lacrymans var. lacrymans S7.9]|nr:uncharacterized protein SERLADRAFT_399866 [Serpula lacrymans var. lacrymans S7.9]EGO20720.1 hypothetical protein SERLADRAFT_399866 [Serpula lacrymans var. lacrymans S7.9]